MNLNQFIILLFLLAVYGSWVVFEQQYLAEPLYAISLKHIKYFRRTFSKYKLLELFFTLVSHLGDKAGVFLTSIISFQFQNGAHAFITSSQICIFVLISQTMKSIIREPRPMMIDSEINVTDCKHLEFGNPSSHTYGASFTFPTLVFLFIQHWEARYSRRCPTIWRRSAYMFVFGLLLLIGFSRVFKGVHTWN